MRLVRFALLGSAVSAFCLVACGGSSYDDADVALVDASVVAEVSVEDNRFGPATLEVAAGTTIRFTNAGRNEHNVVPGDDVASELAVDVDDLTPGTSAERRVTEPGTYRYYCSIHGTADAGMTAVVTVTG